jgi:hypothetical protein
MDGDHGGACNVESMAEASAAGRSLTIRFFGQGFLLL